MFRRWRSLFKRGVLCQFGFGTGAIIKAPAEEATSEALFPRCSVFRMFRGKGAISELNADPGEEH